MLMTRGNQGIMPALVNELMDWNNFQMEDRSVMPKMNVSEGENDYQLEMCVPGLSKNDLALSIDSENNLVVEMVKTEEGGAETADRKYLRREFGKLQFKQLLSLPENVKKEAITAQVENGILSIVLPKFTEQEKRDLMQKIEIR